MKPSQPRASPDPFHPGIRNDRRGQGWEWRGGFLEEVSWFETSPMVIGIEKPAVKCEWKRKVRSNLFWSVLRLVRTGDKPLALLSAGSPRSRPIQGSQARPRRLFQCTAMERQNATSRRKGGDFTLDGGVKEGALWVLRFAVGDGWKGDLIALGLFRM